MAFPYFFEVHENISGKAINPLNAQKNSVSKVFRAHFRIFEDFRIYGTRMINNLDVMTVVGIRIHHRYIKIFLNL